ncbi:MAG: transketolase [Firmicutes bacterium]|nr:transketolase [Bacillota bacterium]
MREEELKHLRKVAVDVRKNIVSMIGEVGVGHIGGAMSIAEVLTVLYYKVMKINPADPKWEERDRFVLSKGHAGPALYAVLAMKGYFPVEELMTLNKPGTKLPSHCDMQRTIGIDMTAGSLGQGISAAVGMAIAAKMDRKNVRVYALIGCGESQEGQVWEAAMLASQKKLDNLIGFTDYNKMQIDGTTDEINSLEPIEDKWKSFGWYTQSVDGHDIKQIYDAIVKAQEVSGKPSMIILNTVKGKGASFCEGKVGSHNMPVTKEDVAQALKELDKGMEE